MCDLDYNEATHMCGNCDVHDVDAAAVIGRINSIGTVELTPESKTKIDSAAAAYNALTAEQQVLVSNYSVLTAAEANLQKASKYVLIIIVGYSNNLHISLFLQSNHCGLPALQSFHFLKHKYNRSFLLFLIYVRL